MDEVFGSIPALFPRILVVGSVPPRLWNLKFPLMSLMDLQCKHIHIIMRWSTQLHHVSAAQHSHTCFLCPFIYYIKLGRRNFLFWDENMLAGTYNPSAVCWDARSLLQPEINTSHSVLEVSIHFPLSVKTTKYWMWKSAVSVWPLSVYVPVSIRTTNMF